MKQFTGRVLIVHGTADEITPIYYSERAADTFADAELISLEGAEHGFVGEEESFAAEQAVLFILDAIDK